MLRELARDAIWELWTDGTVERRTGAGAAQLYLGPAPAGNCTDPFATESLAVKVGLAKITTMRRPGPNKKVIIVYTDSQELTTALQNGQVRQRDAQLAATWKSIYVLYQNGAKRVVFQWISSHCGIPRNESADAAARQALATYGRITQRKGYQNIVSYYKEKNKAQYLSELQRKPNTRSELTTAPANLNNDNTLSRRRQAKLAQLRTGICNTMYGTLSATNLRTLQSRLQQEMQMVWSRTNRCTMCTMNVLTCNFKHYEMTYAPRRGRCSMQNA